MGRSLRVRLGKTDVWIGKNRTENRRAIYDGGGNDWNDNISVGKILSTMKEEDEPNSTHNILIDQTDSSEIVNNIEDRKDDMVMLLIGGRDTSGNLHTSGEILGKLG